MRDNPRCRKSSLTSPIPISNDATHSELPRSPISFLAVGRSRASTQDQGGGMMHRFLGGNFGQAVATGAGIGVGFGVTESLISSIFE